MNYRNNLIFNISNSISYCFIFFFVAHCLADNSSFEQDFKLFETNQLVNSATKLHTSTKKVLILIGYYDDASIHDLRSLIEAQHYYTDSMIIQNAIVNVLQMKGYVKLSSMPEQNTNVSKKNLISQLADKTAYLSRLETPGNSIVVDIINSNVSCIESYDSYVEYLKYKSTNPELSRKYHQPEQRIVGCEKQEKQSQTIMTALNSGLLKNYTHFIYIGHSRLGKGLGLGPFTDENTFSMQFYNNLETGDLQNVIMASCESEKYYKKAIEKLGINFIGLPTLTANSEKQFWTKNANWAIHTMIQQWGL